MLNEATSKAKIAQDSVEEREEHKHFPMNNIFLKQAKEETKPVTRDDCIFIGTWQTIS